MEELEYEDAIDLLGKLVERHGPREAARRYVEEYGEASTFEEAAGDFATMLSFHTDALENTETTEH